MVRYFSSRIKLSQNFKNLRGIDTVLRLDKQGRSVSIILQQKITNSSSTTLLVGEILIILLINFLILNNFSTTKYITTIFVIAIMYQFASAVCEESLIMVHSLGYQVTSKSLIGQRDLFIPWNQVQSIFINEVIVKHKVIHLLTISTKDHEGEKLIPLFVELQPRLQYLELICKHLKGANS